MTIRTNLICLGICCAPCAGLAQSWTGTDVAPAYDAARNTSNASDKTLLLQSDRSRNKLEAALSGYVVAYNSAAVGVRPRVGVPLTTIPNAGLELAYDVSGQSVMAQWRLSQPSSLGNRVDLRAFVDTSGTASLVISTRF